VRRFRGPPLDSRLEEQVRADQRDPARNPRSHSGLLEYARERPRHHRTNPRMPGSGRGVFVSRSSLWTRFEVERGKNSHLL